MKVSSCLRRSSVLASKPKSMEYNLPMGPLPQGWRSRPGYLPISTPVCGDSRSDQEQLAQAPTGHVQAGQAEYGQVARPPQQVGADHTDGQFAQEDHALVQRRALDDHLDRPRIDAERVERGGEQEER